jgi:hypothetical protein
MARRRPSAGAAGVSPPEAQKHVKWIRTAGQAVPPAFLARWFRPGDILNAAGKFISNP